MLDLLLYDNTEFSESDVSKEEDGQDASYLIDSPLDGSELFSLSEVTVGDKIKFPQRSGKIACRSIVAQSENRLRL